MAVPPEQFARIEGRVNLERLRAQLVVVVGVGTVGSQIAEQLARSGVARFRFIDGDVLERENLSRHALTERYVGQNKAEALTEFFADELNVPSPEAVPHDVTDDVSDEELDVLLADADLIISATDREQVQRRIARRALALDVPAVLPALYERNGGEVVVQLSPAFPCFLCWAAHRDEGEPLRAVNALNLHALGINDLAAWLCLGLLDPGSEFAELLQPEPGQRQPQLFVRNQLRTAVLPIRRRPDCPSCAVGPARSRTSPQPAPIDDQGAGPAAEAATGAVVTWAMALAFGGVVAALLFALVAAHSFQIYGKAGYAYGRAFLFLLQAIVLAGLPALAGLWVWEFLLQREQLRSPVYADALVEREGYRRTILFATGGPALVLYLAHGFGPVTPPPWWWLVVPLCACVAHLGFLIMDRFESNPAGDGYWIGGAALTVLLATAMIIGFPDASAGPPTEATASQAQRDEPEEEGEAPTQAREEHEELEELEASAEEAEPPDFFEPCEPVAPVVGVSGYHCTPGQLDVETAFFATQHDAERALFDRATEVEAAGGEAACPAEAPAVQQFQIEEEGEATEGYLLCFIEFGQWHYAWTNTPSFEYRLSEATFPTPFARAAQKWWETSDEEAWRQLPVERVPARYGTCEAAYPEGEAVEAVFCQAGGVAIKAQFFEDWRRAQSYFQEKVLEASPRPGGRCAEAIPAQERFVYRGQQGDPVSGRLLCFVRQGRLVYDWLKPTLRIFGEAEFESADPQAAESWWRGG